MNNELKTLHIGAFAVKIFEPVEDGDISTILLLHGWTGDENSMWIFANKLAPNSLMIAPRGLHASDHPEYGGYSWVSKPSGKWSSMDDFAPSVGAINELLEELAILYPRADFLKLRIAGFSQGAALSYAYALMNPQRILKLAGLAGFLPDNSEALIATESLRGIPFFMAHGTKDESVPIEMAYKAQSMLTNAGANVEFCESEIGHKLGGNCFRSFRAFMDDE